MTWQGLLLLLLCLVVGAAPTPAASRQTAPATRIARDVYGVPHVYAGSASDLFRAWGYAVAQDRLWQLEVTRASVWGRVAELYGPGEGGRYVEYDKWVRSDSYTPGEVWQEIASLPAEYQALLAAYAEGINLAIDEALARPAERLPYEFHLVDVTPQPWTAADVAQVWIGLMAIRFSDHTNELSNAARYKYLVGRHGPQAGAAIFNDLLPLEVPDSPVTCPDWEGGGESGGGGREMGREGLTHRGMAGRWESVPHGGALVAQREAARQALMASVLADLAQPAGLGSQMWMAGGDRTAGVEGLLLGGPQMGFAVPGDLHEVGLHGAGYDVVGTAPPGLPVVLFGHNGLIAWSATGGLGNAVDLFALELVGDDTHYLHDGHVMKMERRTETIQVRGGDPVTVDLYRSLYGPVFDWEEGVAYTKQRAWEGLALQSWAAWLDATRAGDWEAFVQAAGSMALPINWGYADAGDTIGYVHCGRYPIRPPEVDVRLPTRGTGEYDWRGYHPFSWNPQCRDPEQGFLANWNNRPAPGYPIGDTDRGAWNSYDRVHWIAGALSDRPQVTFDDMLAINRQIGLMEHEAAYFIPMFTDLLGADLEPRLEEAAARLLAWDKMLADDDLDGYYDDVAVTIWEVWDGEVIQAVLADELGPYAVRSYLTLNLLLHQFQGDDSPVPLAWDYLNGLPVDQVMQQSLATALHKLEARFGTQDMNVWRTLVRPHTFSTANFRGIPQAAIPVRSLHLGMTRGTENHVVALRPGGAWALNVNPPGQSGFVDATGVPGPHYDDQLDLFEDYRGYKSMLILRPTLYLPLVRRGD